MSLAREGLAVGRVVKGNCPKKSDSDNSFVPGSSILASLGPDSSRCSGSIWLYANMAKLYQALHNDNFHRLWNLP